ncbi:MAG: DNA polymerase III subunit delta [Oscillospiraceae bacterium]|nr:DNA polymerase III subunit delta [Oscillospiraceae bacterium]
MTELKKHIKAGEPAPLYIFHGSEAYLREYYLNKIKELIIPPGTETFNLSVFDKRGFSTQAFIEALETAPFMAEHRLVIVRDVDFFKLKDELEPIFKERWSGTTVVFSFEALEYKPDKRTKLYKLVEAFAATVEFKPQTEKDLIPWIIRRFDSLGKQIDTENAQYLIFLCGRDMTTLINEIEKIAAFASMSEVTRRHIDAVGTPTVEAVVFDLTDALADGEPGKALELLNTLIDNREEPIMILGAIGKQARGLYLARLALDAGQGRDIVMKGMGYHHPYPAEKLIRSAKRFGLERCRRAVTACQRADSELKLGYDKLITLERLIAEMSVC